MCRGVEAVLVRGVVAGVMFNGQIQGPACSEKGYGYDKGSRLGVNKQRHRPLLRSILSWCWFICRATGGDGERRGGGGSATEGRWEEGAAGKKI